VLALSSVFVGAPILHGVAKWTFFGQSGVHALPFSRANTVDAINGIINVFLSGHILPPIFVDNNLKRPYWESDMLYLEREERNFQQFWTFAYDFRGVVGMFIGDFEDTVAYLWNWC
jgi:hypothetical protein